MVNLAHSASFDSEDKDAPSKPGIKHLSSLLRNRFLPIDEEPAQNQIEAIKSLDLASPEATQTLQLLAGKAWEVHKAARPLRDFFVR